jgi:hypothetical protein
MRVDFEIPGRAAPKGSRTVGFRKDGSVTPVSNLSRWGLG